MTTIKVNSLPVLEVIKDLATAFDTNYTSNICEYEVRIPSKLGIGNIKAYELDNGLGILHYNCAFHDDMEIKFIVNEVHPLKFIYVTTGNLQHRFENEDKIHSIEEYQSAILANCNNYGHILNFKANTLVAQISVEINRAAFNLSSAYKSEDVDTTLYNLFTDKEATEIFYYQGDYSLNIADIFNTLKSNDDNFSGDRLVQNIFMQSIAYRILFFQLKQYLDESKNTKSQNVLRRKEFEQVKKAVIYINENLESYSGLEELTRHTGLNPIKLQKGFKYLYHFTVNQYVQERRLEMARNLLLKSDKSINEIVTIIGLKSSSYFSRIFKDKYGVQPSLFNKNI